MNKEVNVELIVVFWPQRHWKTLYTTLLACDRINRLYGNIDIKFKWVPMTQPITNHLQFNDFKIWYHDPWYMLVDEIGMNFNSKDAASKKNKTFSDFVFLMWKYWLSTIWVAQRWNSVPVDIRELATKIFEVRKILRKGQHPLFSVIEYKLAWDWELEYQRENTIDIISILDKWWVSYNTLETSIIS